MRPGASGEKSLSKSALKNQKKREAKKAARQVSGHQPIRRLDLSSPSTLSLTGEHVLVILTHNTSFQFYINTPSNTAGDQD